MVALFGTNGARSCGSFIRHMSREMKELGGEAGGMTSSAASASRSSRGCSRRASCGGGWSPWNRWREPAELMEPLLRLPDQQEGRCDQSASVAIAEGNQHGPSGRPVHGRCSKEKQLERSSLSGQARRCGRTPRSWPKTAGACPVRSSAQWRVQANGAGGAHQEARRIRAARSAAAPVPVPRPGGHQAAGRGALGEHGSGSASPAARCQTSSYINSSPLTIVRSK